MIEIISLRGLEPHKPHGKAILELCQALANAEAFLGDAYKGAAAVSGEADDAVLGSEAHLALGRLEADTATVHRDQRGSHVDGVEDAALARLEGSFDARGTSIEFARCRYTAHEPATVSARTNMAS